MFDVNHGRELVRGAVARTLPLIAVVGLLVARRELAAVHAKKNEKKKRQNKIETKNVVTIPIKDKKFKYVPGIFHMGRGGEAKARQNKSNATLLV